MYNMKFLNLSLALSLAFLFACNTNKEKTTPDGVKYTLLSSEDGAALEEGDFAIYSLRMVNSKDSVLINSEEVGDMPLQIDSATMSKRGPLFSVLSDMRLNDSVKTTQTATEIFTKGFRQPLQPDMEADEMITVYAKAKEKLDSAGFMQWQQERRKEMMAKMQKEAEEQKVLDEKAIKTYLEENNLEAQRTESGLYYIIKEEGTGESPERGDTVRVDYTGMLLDGSIFDTSNEEVAKANDIFSEQRPSYEPLAFPVGQGRVIPGWDEGLQLLSEGAKATFIIPSALAYGARGAGAGVPPNSVLLFEVELVDVAE